MPAVHRQSASTGSASRQAQVLRLLAVGQAKASSVVRAGPVTLRYWAEDRCTLSDVGKLTVTWLFSDDPARSVNVEQAT